MHSVQLIFALFCFLFSYSLIGQTYTSYFTGNMEDVITNPQAGVCMMGGATEDDEAMKWFLQRADGGDVLVLRASGSDGYNDYMYSELGITINSVETIVFHEFTANLESYIHERIQKAEAIWFAGGNQWDYVRYWRNSAIDSLINEGITQRNIVIGGTSAGMAILGGFYFSAQNGTVTSGAALANPYNSNVKVDSAAFLQNDFLSNVITDTHYDDPDRKGRHVVFMSRILTNYGADPKGIACDEYTAVCLGTDGVAQVFGQYPDFDDNAYFIQTNCELSDVTPENCTPGNPLTWNLNNQAIKVYKVKGTSSGKNTFDLNDWATGSGGTWENWYVNNGMLTETPDSAIHCIPSSAITVDQSPRFQLYPNPASNFIVLEFDQSESGEYLINIVNSFGEIVKRIYKVGAKTIQLDLDRLSSGLYFLQIKTATQVTYSSGIVIQSKN